MKRLIALLLVLSLVGLIIAGCSTKDQPQGDILEESQQGQGEEDAEKDTTTENVGIKVVTPGGPTTVSLIKMIKEKPVLGKNVEVEYEIIDSTDLLASKILSNEADFIVAPTNLISNLYNKGVKYTLGASTVWGVLYVAGSEDINSWDDLKGKELATIGRGLTPDILFRFILKENGLDPDKDVTLTYYSGPQELAQIMIAGKNSLGVVPEPVLTTVKTKNENIKTIFDLQKEWEKVTGKFSYPQSALFIKNEIIEKYPDVVEAFLQEYEESINWVNENRSTAGEWVEELNIGLNAKVVEKAIPGCNLRYMTAQESKEYLEEYLKVLLDFSPDSIGGKIPDEGLYLKE